MTARAPFPIQPELTQIALAYRNPAYIADMVMPRAVVGTQEFKYLSHTKAESYTIPDTTVGRKGRTNEVEFSATESTSATIDYGLEVGVPQSDIENAPVNYNPLGRSTELLSELVMLDRELRVATQVFTAGNYATANKETLAGSDQWTHASSDPIAKIMAALDAAFIRPNFMVLGQEAWTALRQNPVIMKATNKNSGDKGAAARAAVAELFELQDIYVGQGRYNSAKPNQTPTYGRLWTDSALLFYKNPTATPSMGVTFGLTAQWGDKVAMQWEDRNIGLRGGQRVRMGESVKELILAADCAFLFSDCCG